jgi:hypothetical protein
MKKVIKAIIVSLVFLTMPTYSDEQLLYLTVAISKDRLEIYARGGSLPMFYKEEGANLWALHKESEKDLGKIKMSEDICSNGKSATCFKLRSVYDELARHLIMIHNRFIDDPTVNEISIYFTDDLFADNLDSLDLAWNKTLNKIVKIMDTAKAAGFYKIKNITYISDDANSAKTAKIIDKAKKTGYHINIEEHKKPTRSGFSSYNLMKDPNFTKDIDKVLKNVKNLEKTAE